MKKMPFAFIFIVIFSLLVFAGCKVLVKTPSDNPGTEDPSYSENYSADENFTDEDGETLFSDNETSSSENEPGSTSGAGSTSPSDKNEGTTGNQTEESNTAGAGVSVNEYDVLRSGQFYMEGSLYADGELGPMAIAVGDGLVYMQTSMDGLAMGFLISGGNTYLLNSSDKTYCEFGSLLSGVLAQAGMMTQEEIMGLMSEMGFSTMDDLSEADEVNNATLNGEACTVYIFNRPDKTKTRVFMDGDHLLAFEVVNSRDIVESATYINKITADIPALPPSDYTRQNIIAFLTSMESVLGY